MTRMKDKSNYSIQNLQDSIREVMEGEFTPKQIHEVIVDTVKDNMRYYRACYNDSVRLLALLKVNTDSNESSNERDYWDGKLNGKEFKDALEKYGFEYTPPTDSTKFKLDSPELHKPLTHQEMIDAGYEMTGEGIWWPKDNEDED